MQKERGRRKDVGFLGVGFVGFFFLLVFVGFCLVFFLLLSFKRDKVLITMFSSIT